MLSTSTETPQPYGQAHTRANKLLEYALEGLSGLCGHTPIKITNYVFNTRKLQKRELQVP